MRQSPALSSTLQAAGAVRVSGRREVREALLARLIRSIGGIVSFEALFLLFVFAGAFKGMPELRWFPVDLTLFFFVLSLAAAVSLWLSGKHSVGDLDDAGVVLYMLFLSWVLLSITWSSFDQFSIEKTLNTLILVSWCFFGGYLIVAEQWRRVTRFLIIFMVISIAQISYWGYYRFVLGVVHDVTGATEAGTYLRYSFHAQFLVAILMALTVAGQNFARALMGILTVVAVLVLMLFIGGRGPLFDALLTVPLALLFLLMNPNARRYRSRFLSVLLCLVSVLGLVALLLIWADSGVVEQLRPEMKTVERLDNLSEPQFDSSASARIQGQHFAFESWLEAPIIGWGVGEFNRLGPEGLVYPHNLFLEVLMEQGLIGFGLLAALTGLGLVRAWRLWPAGRPQWPVIALILLFIPWLMARAVHQGFLPDERVLFVLLGLILRLGRRAASGTGAL